MKAVELNMYDEKTGEIEKTVTQNFIPWKLTKDLLKAQKQINENPSAEESLGIMEDIIIKAFQGKVTKKDLEKCDIGDIPKTFKVLGERLQGH